MKELPTETMFSKEDKKIPNKFEHIFNTKNKVLNIYCTAGYPRIDSTLTVMRALQNSGADIIEIGMPYSDPLADGPVIQQSNSLALANGMSMELMFQQLREGKSEINIPVILMGYLNPVLQYGIEKFCKDATSAGVDGIILPDLPMYEYQRFYRDIFKKHNLHFIFLITPETSTSRIIKADGFSSGFLYAVSSSATTGNDSTLEVQDDYLLKISELNLKNPVLIGFGIRDNHSFEVACKYASGAVIGSAYIKAIKDSEDIAHDTEIFISSIREG